MDLRQLETSEPLSEMPIDIKDIMTKWLVLKRVKSYQDMIASSAMYLYTRRNAMSVVILDMTAPPWCAAFATRRQRAMGY